MKSIVIDILFKIERFCFIIFIRTPKDTYIGIL